MANMADPRSRGRRNTANNAEKKAKKQIRGATPDNVEYEDAEGITINTLKKSTKLVIISIVFFFLTMGLLAGYIFMFNNAVTSKQHACWLTQQNIETMANDYVVKNGLSSLPAYVEDLPAFQSTISDCPAGGAYTWNPITGEYSCSEHGHWPQGFNEQQSILTGTQKVVIEDNTNSSS